LSSVLDTSMDNRDTIWSSATF